MILTHSPKQFQQQPLIMHVPTQLKTNSSFTKCALAPQQQTQMFFSAIIQIAMVVGDRNAHSCSQLNAVLCSIQVSIWCCKGLERIGLNAIDLSSKRT